MTHDMGYSEYEGHLDEDIANDTSETWGISKQVSRGTAAPRWYPAW